MSWWKYPVFQQTMVTALKHKKFLEVLGAGVTQWGKSFQKCSTILINLGKNLRFRLDSFYITYILSKKPCMLLKRCRSRGLVKVKRNEKSKELQWASWKTEAKGMNEPTHVVLSCWRQNSTFQLFKIWQKIFKKKKMKIYFRCWDKKWVFKWISTKNDL